MIKEKKKIFQYELQNRKIIWNIKKLPEIYGDYTMIKQVMINLISNSLKYTRKKNKTIIEIGSYKKNKEYIIFINDNGIGFNMKYSYKLFGVFQRLHSSKEFEGTGIGLSIVKKIINMHGGKVWIESKLNKGTTIYFSIPFSNNN